MRLYVFEPYKWDYCGGAIVVVAEDLQHAHSLIWEHEEKENNGRLHRHEVGVASPWSIKMDGAMFAPYPRIEGRFMLCDRWELTNVFLLGIKETPEVVTYNYNYG